MSLFEKGMVKTGGRVKGVKNRLSHAFLTALAKDFEEHGEDAIKICRVEKPNEYLRLIGALMPKELELTDSRLKELDDEQLDAVISWVQSNLSRTAASAASGEDPKIY